MVDGMLRRTETQARHDLEWADLVLVWCGTELHHKVIGQYIHGVHSEKVVHVAGEGWPPRSPRSLRPAAAGLSGSVEL